MLLRATLWRWISTKLSMSSSSSSYKEKDKSPVWAAAGHVGDQAGSQHHGTLRVSLALC